MSKVTFGDGNSAKICGKSTSEYSGMSKLEEALYIAGLKANLFSISQLCDISYKVNFSKKVCTM